MVSSSKSRPIYATVWFNVAATVILLFLLFGATLWQDFVQLPRATGNFVVVVLAGYWAFVFPKLRKKTGSAPFTGK